MKKVIWAVLICSIIAIIILLISAYQRGLLFNCCESEGMLCKEWCNETEIEEALEPFQNITWNTELPENLTACRSISDCDKNFSLAGCKKLDCNTCCCNPHTCTCTLVYCGYLDKCYFWNYTLKEWILNETCIENLIPPLPKGSGILS